MTITRQHVRRQLRLLDNELAIVVSLDVDLKKALSRIGPLLRSDGTPLPRDVSPARSSLELDQTMGKSALLAVGEVTFGWLHDIVADTPRQGAA